MIDYSVLQEIVVLANAVSSPGGLRVNMTAHVVGEQNGSSFYAETGIWEDGYAYHLQHSGGLKPEELTDITERLQRDRYAEFHLFCFMDALVQIGFVGVPRA